MPAASSNCDTIVTYVLLEGSLLRLVLIGRMLICWPLIYCDYRHNNVTRTTVLHLGSSQSTKRQTVVRL